MKNIAKPYKVSPYHQLVKLGCPWVADMKERVLKRIDEIKQLIVNEAEADGQPELADVDYRYESFLYNKEHNMMFGNIHILKYFVLEFKMKILYNMIGEWKFTEYDKAMYSYFRENNFAGINYSKVNKQLTYVTAEEPRFFVHDKNCKWFIMVADDGKTVEDFYVNLFRHEYIMLDDMVRNVKNLEANLPDDRMFVDMFYPEVVDYIK